MNKFPRVKPEVGEYFNNYSFDLVEKIINEFHSKELSIQKIIQKFELAPISSNKFVKQLPPIDDFGFICPKCEVVSWRDSKSRGKKSLPYCPKCKEMLLEDFDPYRRAKELRFEKERRLRRLFHDPDYYEHEIHITMEKFSSLSLFEKVFLGSIMWVNFDSENYVVKGKYLQKSEDKIFPVDAELDASLPGLRGESNINYTQCLYRFDKNVVNLLVECEDRLGASIEEQLEVWRTIALAESEEYLIDEMDRYGLMYRSKNIFKIEFSKLLKKHSVSQTFHLIYKSVGEACKYYSICLDKNAASNSVVGKCVRMAEYYPTRNWPIMNYDRRNFQSFMSQYFHNKLLKIGNDGFVKVPSISVLQPIFDEELDESVS